jgi:hypothetical protein
MFFAKLRDAVRVMFPGKVPQHLSMVARLESECRPQSKAARIVITSRLTARGTKLMKEAAGPDEEITNPVAYRDGLIPHGSRMSGKCQRRKSRGRPRSLTSVDERVAPLPLEPAFSLGQI